MGQYEKFLSDYREHFHAMVFSLETQGREKEKAKEIAHLVLNRLLMLYFLQEKRLLSKREKFLENYMEDYKNSKDAAREIFYQKWLKKLFFGGINRMKANIFELQQIDRHSFHIPDEILFNTIENFFQQYEYSSSEWPKNEHKTEHKDAIRPDIMGKIYETLIVEKERGKRGIFYTPQAEVDLMCRIGIVKYLKENRVLQKCSNPIEANRKEFSFSESELVKFVFQGIEEWDSREKTKFQGLITILTKLKILDPSCGAGAFLLGIFQTLIELYKKLGLEITYELKQSILQNNLYGVDVKNWGLRIASYRLYLLLWNNLKLTKEKHRNFNRETLNLRCGDSILDLSISPKKEQTGIKPIFFEPIAKKGGFDLIIGNPPYVDGRNIDKDYKQKIHEYIKQVSGIELYKTSDLYVYFFFQALELLNPAGTLVYLTSSSWLGVKYGKKLQDGLLRLSDLELIIDKQHARSFLDAEINTVITVASKKKTGNGTTKFVSLRNPLECFMDPRILDEIIALREKNPLNAIKYRGESLFLREEETFRKVQIHPNSLWILGGGRIDEKADICNDLFAGNYHLVNWRAFLRAPKIYFSILDKAGKKLKILEDSVEAVKTGMYSGLNDFYYFECERGREYESKIPKKYKLPLIRNTQQIKRPLFKLQDVTSNVLICKENKETLKRNGEKSVLEYIEWGESQKKSDGRSWPEVSSVRKRKPGYWALPDSYTRETNLFVGYIINDRFTVGYSEIPTCSDRCFHRVFGEKERLFKVLGSLCSTISVLFIELMGTNNLGQGALKFETRMLKKLLIVDPKEISLNRIGSLLHRLGKRKIAPIFEELGAKKPQDISLKTVKKDRKNLDDYIMGEILGLNKEERLSVYKEVVKLVETRLKKASR